MSEWAWSIGLIATGAQVAVGVVVYMWATRRGRDAGYVEGFEDARSHGSWRLAPPCDKRHVVLVGPDEVFDQTRDDTVEYEMSPRAESSAGRHRAG